MGHVASPSGAFHHPDDLTDAILEGIRDQKMINDMGVAAVGEISNVGAEAPFDGEYEPEDEWFECWDEVTGKALDPVLVRRARAEEMEYFGKMNVYDRVRGKHRSDANGWMSIRAQTRTQTTGRA